MLPVWLVIKKPNREVSRPLGKQRVNNNRLFLELLQNWSELTHF